MTEQSWQSWQQALDDYGRALLDFEHRFELEGHAAGTFSYRLPTGLGPIPLELIEIAVALVERSRDAEEQVRLAMADIAVQRRNVRQGRMHMAQQRPTAHFIDVRG
jgi:hypothetical protein